MKNFQNFGLVLAANFETIVYMGLGWFFAGYLNEHYPRDYDWAKVTYVFALLLIVRSWYVVFRVLIRSQKKLSQEDQTSQRSAKDKTDAS